MSDSVIWFENLKREDVPLVGGKNASLGEMVQNLQAAGIRVPPGYATSADAFREYLHANNLVSLIDDTMDAYANGRLTLHQAGLRIREAIAAERSGKDGTVGRRALQRHRRGPAGCQFRRPAGDLSERRGEDALLDACRRCYASLFTDRAISYRNVQGFDHMRWRCRSACSRWCAPIPAARG
jgi:pyruvate,water dikinase